MRKIVFRYLVWSRKWSVIFLTAGIFLGVLIGFLEYTGDGHVYDLDAPVQISSRKKAEDYPFEQDTQAIYGKININTAGLEELDRLPGIGSKMAERIILFRNQKHTFGVTEEIMAVPGIGEKKYESMKDMICVE